MLTKLKYTWVNRKDLLEIYSLFVRSRAEYMSVAWHSSLTAEEEHKIENIQKTSLKIILGDNYVDYPTSLIDTGLKSLFERRQDRCLAFAKRCLSNPQTRDMFPLNQQNHQDLRQPEKYMVNFANTENYRRSTVPFCQRLLNRAHKEEEERRKEMREEAGTRHQGREGAGTRREGTR